MSNNLGTLIKSKHLAATAFKEEVIKNKTLISLL